VRIHVVAVGALREPHFKAAAAEYLKRLTPYADVCVAEIPDRDLGHDAVRAVTEEGRGVLKALPEGGYVVAMDAAGRELDSEGLAGWLAQRMNQGDSTLAFVVGGADGLSSEVLDAARERMSLSRLTLPHQLARVVLLEQLYRSFRIIRGEPYHR
jgi:23S rRNA (pseudouridine1915-N3)-methyltransferase